MSNETPKRPYRQKRRAELAEQTRLRITQAAVELHGSVGPAQTSVSALAELAGVERATVYRHFPDEEALFDACSAHWRADHPYPDPEPWAKIADPVARTRTALSELYAYYGGAGTMIDNLIRDAPSVAAIGPRFDRFWEYLDAIAGLCVAGRGLRGRRAARTRAALGHALDQRTWRSLNDRGLSRAEAVDLMGAMVEAAAAPVSRRRQRAR
jgi:AcrR family transcriptional regulator